MKDIKEMPAAGTVFVSHLEAARYSTPEKMRWFLRRKADNVYTTLWQQLVDRGYLPLDAKAHGPEE